MSARDFRSFGRAAIPSEAGDVAVWTIARKTGAPSPGWKGPRWTRELYVRGCLAKILIAVPLHHCRLRDLRVAARDPNTNARTRRALNRHIRAQRALGER